MINTPFFWLGEEAIDLSFADFIETALIPCSYVVDDTFDPAQAEME